MSDSGRMITLLEALVVAQEGPGRIILFTGKRLAVHSTDVIHAECVLFGFDHLKLRMKWDKARLLAFDNVQDLVQCGYMISHCLGCTCGIHHPPNTFFLKEPRRG